MKKLLNKFQKGKFYRLSGFKNTKFVSVYKYSATFKSTGEEYETVGSLNIDDMFIVLEAEDLEKEIGPEVIGLKVLTSDGIVGWIDVDWIKIKRCYQKL